VDFGASDVPLSAAEQAAAHGGAAATSYVPLPPSIQQLAHATLERITCPNGQRLG
jgi:hypothetical protein